VTQDNPRLTARIEGEEEWCPRRIVFDGKLTTVPDGDLGGVYTDEFRERTIVVTTRFCDERRRNRLENLGVKVWTFETEAPVVSISDFRGRCAEAGITGVLVEGGSGLLSEMLRSRALDYFFVYSSPTLLADDKAKPALAGLRTDDLRQSIRLADLKRAEFDEDALVRGRVVYPEKMEIESR
jgi:diaminohydroxyphosphoribosylaminopyrimidine deaminase/5-amino-6-(5-phosphoribosylamino)uracil reductase